MDEAKYVEPYIGIVCELRVIGGHGSDDPKPLTNHVVYGATDLRIDLSGYSILEVERMLGVFLGMRPGPRAFIEGMLEEDKARILQPGEFIEFMP